jgi:hypothetical protein
MVKVSLRSKQQVASSPRRRSFWTWNFGAIYDLIRLIQTSSFRGIQISSLKSGHECHKIIAIAKYE